MLRRCIAAVVLPALAFLLACGSMDDSSTGESSADDAARSASTGSPGTSSGARAGATTSGTASGTSSSPSDAEAPEVAAVDGPNLDVASPPDGGATDASPTEGAAPQDAGRPDSASIEAGGGDGAARDATTADAGKVEAGALDASVDTTVADTGSVRDASAADSTVSDGAAAGDAGPVVGSPVLQFHNHANRDGVYVDPLITAVAAGKMHKDSSFNATVDGNVYAQPLYVANGPGGSPAFVVATENNNVYALDPNGAQLWMQPIGASAARADNCGNVQPLGITGTPVIDMTRRAVYLNAARPGTGTTNMREHEIHALSLDSGAELAGWPIKASTVTGVVGAAAGSSKFVPNPQNQRGALTILGSTLYVPYGGHAGDCADSNNVLYRGWVIGVPLDNPAGVTGFVTTSMESGIWSVGGLATDGTSLYATTGNANGGQNCPSPPPMSPPPGWGQQEAILRLQPGPVWGGQVADYWAPDDWPCLDNGDGDVGGSSPVLVDLPSGSPQHLVIALGKDGNMYVADRTNLGGVGPAAATKAIMNGEMKMAPAAYTTPNGTYVVAYGAGSTGVGCPNGQSGNLVAVRITPGSPPTLAVAWCADEKGQGSPIFTTSNGTQDNLVWAIGADSSNQLRAWDADTGAVVFDGGASGDVATGFNHFSTIIAVGGRIFAGANGTLYAYTSN